MKNNEWKWDEGPIGRLIKMGYITLRRDLEELLRPYGLSHTQWSALGVICHYPGISPSQLEPILMIERPSVTSLLNGMEKKGLIIRKEDPQDKRGKLIFPTDKGINLAEETQVFTTVIEEKVKNGMTHEEFAMLKTLLIKMVHILEEKS